MDDIAVTLLQELICDDDETNAVIQSLHMLQTAIRHNTERNIAILGLSVLQGRKEFSDRRVKNYVEEVVPKYRDSTFACHFRMSRSAFEVLCEKVNSISQATATTFTPLETKLLLTLWFLGNQETFSSVSDRFDMSKGAAHRIVMEITQLLCQLKYLYIRWPEPGALARLAEDFDNRCGFPGVVGCMGSSDIHVKPPNCHNRVDFINRKGWPSINMLAICDTTMAFTYIYADMPGSCPNAGVFRASEAFNLLQELPCPYHVLGNSAYPLKTSLLTPYRDNGHLTPAQKKFNRCHSSTHRVIGKAFDRLNGKFRMLKYIDMTRIDKMPQVIEAACVLHNFTITEDNTLYSDDEENVDPSKDDHGINEDHAEQFSDSAGRVKRDELADLLCQNENLNKN